MKTRRRPSSAPGARAPRSYGSSRGLHENHAERRHRQRQRIVATMHRDRRGIDAAEIPEPGAAVVLSVAIQQLAPLPGTRDTDAEIQARHRREITDDEYLAVTIAPQKTQRRLLDVVTIDPFETAGIVIAAM